MFRIDSDDDDDRLYPKECVYCGAPSTFKHEMWECQPAVGVWKHANNLLAAMSLPTLASIYDLPNIILLDKSIKNVIAANVLIQAAHTNWCTYHKKMTSYQEGTFDEEECSNLTLKSLQSYHSALKSEIRALPGICHSLDPSNNKCTVIPKVDLKQMSNEITDLYKQTWLLTDLIEITNNALTIKPFRQDPP